MPCFRRSFKRGGLVFSLLGRTGIGTLAVSVFFFYSGYGLQKSYLTKENYLDGFLLKRLSKVLIPYLVAIFIYWFYYASLNNIFSLRRILGSFVKGDNPIVQYSWYVVNIIIFYVAFYILGLILKKRKSLMILGSALFDVLWIIFSVKRSYGVWWYDATHLLVLGVFWATYEKKILKILKEHYYISAFCVIFIDLAIYAFDSAIKNDTAKLVLSAINYLLFVVVLMLLLMKFKIGNGILNFLGKISFEFYLIHGIFLMMTPIKDAFPEWAWFLITLSASIFSSYILNMASKELVLNFQNILSKFKKPRQKY